MRFLFYCNPPGGQFFNSVRVRTRRGLPEIICALVDFPTNFLAAFSLKVWRICRFSISDSFNIGQENMKRCHHAGLDRDKENCSFSLYLRNFFPADSKRLSSNQRSSLWVRRIIPLFKLLYKIARRNKQEIFRFFCRIFLVKFHTKVMNYFKLGRDETHHHQILKIFNLCNNYILLC